MFVRFGAAHLAAMALIAAAAVASARLARRERARPLVRWGLVALLAGATLAFYVGETVAGTLSGWDFLPFHLSDFAVFLSVYALIALRQRAAEFLYFVAIAAVFALVTPDLRRGFDDWYAWTFFALHGGVVAAAAALTFGFRLVPERGAVVRAFLLANAYLLFAAVLNVVLGTNFMYLRRKPAQSSPLDLLGGWPWYILVGEVLALALFTLAYLPFARRRSAEEASGAPPPR